jgi:hypothetical protein
VRLLYGISKLDSFYRAPLAWPAAERTTNVENTFLKVAALTSNSLRPQATLPFSGVESEFLIGLTFRLILRDVIFSSQERHDQGVLQHQVLDARRDPVYQEIEQLSFKDYFQKFVIPYYQTRGIDLTQPETLEKAGDLRTYAAGLKGNGKVRLITNQNDFLLADSDLTWLHDMFGPEQLTVFATGGHLGNLAHPAVQKAILGALAGLQPAPAVAPAK